MGNRSVFAWLMKNRSSPAVSGSGFVAAAQNRAWQAIARKRDHDGRERAFH